MLYPKALIPKPSIHPHLKPIASRLNLTNFYLNLIRFHLNTVSFHLSTIKPILI